MAAFKNRFLVLAVVLLAMISATGTANAQLFTCTAFSVPPQVRSEGVSELTGDIIAQCTGGTGTVTTNVNLTLNTNMTNNRDFSSGSTITDAVLWVNGSAASPAAATAPPTAFAIGTPRYGTRISDTQLQWADVLIPINGTVRISNVRANASQFGESPAFGTQIVGLLNFTGASSVPITNNVLNIATPTNGLSRTYSDAIGLLQCEELGVDSDGNIVVGTATATNVFRIRLTEGFGSSFKTLGTASTVPGVVSQAESGFSVATQATRLIIRFYNVPAGIRLGSPLSTTADTSFVTGATAVATKVVNADANGAGGTLATSNSDITPSGFAGGNVSVVYEVTAASTGLVERIPVFITVAFKADTANDKPTPGTIAVRADFAPLSTTSSSNASAPEPRFVEEASSSDRATVSRCRSTLLFPFVTNQVGFDTGWVISNTTKDPLKTKAQAGTCTINYFGSTTGGGAAPPADTTTVVTAGTQIFATVSGGNSAFSIDAALGFQGYIITQCEFQFAHGFAFITDGFGGVQAIAEGYLALVIPTATDNTRPAAGTGEGLNN